MAESQLPVRCLMVKCSSLAPPEEDGIVPSFSLQAFTIEGATVTPGEVVLVHVDRQEQKCAGRGISLDTLEYYARKPAMFAADMATSDLKTVEEAWHILHGFWHQHGCQVAYGYPSKYDLGILSDLFELFDREVPWVEAGCLADIVNDVKARLQGEPDPDAALKAIYDKSCPLQRAAVSTADKSRWQLALLGDLLQALE